MTTPQYLPQVREQYEALPYPHRDPLDEKKRLARTWLDDLAMINHYCYAGRQSFSDRFRVLVAGGGTGDQTIYLAQQLRHTNAEIVHIDLSHASIEIAKQRAQVRELSNITWVNNSLLGLPELGLGTFDYINCSGVLHHLQDPDAGFRALLAVLKPTGAMGILLYGQVGRTGIYQMQSLMRLVNRGIDPIAERIRNAREVLNSLPRTNWYKRGTDIYSQEDGGGDAGIYDTFLHSQDRAYTVEELYEWLHDRHGMHLEFTDVGRGSSAYTPALVVGPQQPGFLDTVRALPLRQQQQIAELLRGDLITHTFYVTRGPQCKAPYGDIDYVPFFFNEPVTGPDLSGMVRNEKNRPFVLSHQYTGVTVQFDPGKYSADILQHIDGKRCFAEIFVRVRAEPQWQASPPGDEELFRDFRPFYDVLTAIERMLLRHRSVAPVAAS
jgi:2-polyprenyl-3-methyl-5-hydroxy-6-metoxy-1,4-benzoquinol methylase